MRIKNGHILQRKWGVVEGKVLRVKIKVALIIGRKVIGVLSKIKWALFLCKNGHFGALENAVALRLAFSWETLELLKF